MSGAHASKIAEWPSGLDPYIHLPKVLRGAAWSGYDLEEVTFKFHFTGFTTVAGRNRGDAVDIEEPKPVKPRSPNRIVRVMVGLDYELSLFGALPSKKNMYRPRKDRPGVFKDAALRRELNRLALQIPGELRGLELVHPDIEVFLEIPPNQGRQRPNAADRDGKLTTILDLLVSYGVLKDDSIRYCNGTVIVHPAKIGTQHYTKVVLRLRTDPDVQP